MEFLPFFNSELEKARANAVLQKQRDADAARARAAQAQHNAIRDRGLRLGARLTGLFRRTGWCEDDYEKYMLSKIAALPLEPDSEYQEQVRFKYKPPEFVSYKVALPAKAIVSLRIHDLQSGAKTGFRNVASFENKQHVHFADSEHPGYLMPVGPDSPRLPEVDQFLSKLEVARFDIKE